VAQALEYFFSSHSYDGQLASMLIILMIMIIKLKV